MAVVAAASSAPSEELSAAGAESLPPPQPATRRNRTNNSAERRMYLGRVWFMVKGIQVETLFDYRIYSKMSKKRPQVFAFLMESL